MIGLRIAQINLQHARAPTAVLRRHLDICTMKIVLIQEPYFYKDSFGELDAANGTIIFKQSNLRPRSCIFVSKDINFHKIDRFCNTDFVTINLKYKLKNIETSIILCSAYFPYDSTSPPPPKEIVDLVQYAKDLNTPLILGCDSNAHHLAWGSTDTNTRGESLIDFICMSNLEILNVGSKPTFVTSNREEVLDLTLCSMTFVGNISNWHVHNEDSLSDHQMIVFDISSDYLVPITYRNPKDTDLDLFNAYLEAGLVNWNIPNGTKESVDRSAEAFSNLINFAYERSCPLKIRKSNQKTIWWNSYLQKEKKKNNYAWNHRNEGDYFRSQQRVYKNLIRDASRNSFQIVSSSVDSLPAAARLNKLMSISKNTQIDSILLPNGDFLFDEKDILTHLLKTHFPECRPPDNSMKANLNNHSLSLDEYTVEKILNEDCIQLAIFSFKPYKSAGPDNIFPKLLQSATKTIIVALKQLFRSSLILKHIPSVWQSVRIVFIPKPGKPSYDNPKSFRPISLTSFLLKTLERLVENFVSNSCLIHYPLHERQHSYQKGKSTETALHEVVQRIEKAMSFDEVCLAAFLDVEGAFDNTSFDVIGAAARNHGFPESLIAWTTSLLQQRMLNATLKSITVQMTPVKGCPQGGVLSPLLWNLVANDLLTILNNNYFFTIGYADDFVILLVGKFTNIVYERMQCALKLVESWCLGKKLSVNAQKSNLVLFTKCRNLPGVKELLLFGNPIPQVDEVKYLGVILDKKLNWNAHLEDRYKRAIKIFFQCRKIIGTNWGLKPKYALWLFNMIIRPIVTYASLVWWPKVNQISAQNVLSKIQRIACLCITGAFKTTPTRALEVILDMRPLHIQIKAEAMSSAYRLSSLNLLKVDYNFGHCAILTLLHQSIPLSLAPSDLIIRSNSTMKNFEVIIPLRHVWSGSWPFIRPPDSLIFFSDGSNKNGRSGAGIYCEQLDINISSSLGQHVSAFQAELFGILECLKFCLTQNFHNRFIIICTDCKSVLQTLNSFVIKSWLAQECINILNNLGQFNTVSLIWVPGHYGLYGNQYADRLAKFGSSQNPIGPGPHIPLSASVIKDLIASWSYDQHCFLWNSLDTCQNSKLLIDKPLYDDRNWITNLSRSQQRKLVGAITGHCALKDHLFKIGLSTDRLCRYCQSDTETTYHIICLCPHFVLLRMHILDLDYINENKYAELKVKDILKFINACKVLDI